ncbi:flagellar hook-basal body complex protein [Noviherbaspirillum sp. 1P10PC]|uniref:flagellar hook-basal body protein n=1 Tax=Noviherbaspirillum sp. 1P10PC TaxID=3132292 RepID=UPI0039A1B16F
MLDSLFIGAVGMAAQQAFIDSTANNLVNLSTPSFKKNRVSFKDMVYHGLERADAPIAGDAQQWTGTGSTALLLGKMFSQGKLDKTGVPNDVAINGEGMVELVLPDGASAYTRTLTLQVSRDGLLSTADGYPLHQQISLPPDAGAIQIDRTGRVTVDVPNERNPVEVGQIELTRFVNPAGLIPLGDNLYGSSEKAGDPISGKPGEAGFGVFMQGYSEASNVQLVEEMISLTLAQRAYEASAKVVQASDEMLGIVNNLRR